MRKIIAVDVDLTVVDTLSPWIHWYKSLTGHDIFEEIKNTEWNVNELMHRHESPMDFWKQSDLYDNLYPIQEAKNVLDILSEQYDVIFVSSCFPEHIKSKEFFIKRNFPYYKAFINANNKGYTLCDYFIDDYLKNIEQFNTNTKCFHIQTDLNKNQTSTTWFDILKYIKGDE